MNNVVSDFLTFFNLTGLQNVSDSITVAQFLALIVICFVALVFTVTMLRVVMEFIKIIMEWGKIR